MGLFTWHIIYKSVDYGQKVLFFQPQFKLLPVNVISLGALGDIEIGLTQILDQFVDEFAPNFQQNSSHQSFLARF